MCSLYSSIQINLKPISPPFCCKAAGQLAPTDFSTFVHGNGVDKENPFRHLPGAQSISTKFLEFFFAKIAIRYHARGYFFVTQCSGGCRTPEHHCLSHTAKAQQLRFNFRRVHLFPCDINRIRNSTDDFESGISSREQIVGNENSV